MLPCVNAPGYHGKCTVFIKYFLGFSELILTRSFGIPMFKLRSIAARLILAISLTVAVACAILGTFSVMQQRSLTRLALDQQLKLQYDSVIAAIDYEGRAALAVSSVDRRAAAGWRRHQPRAIATDWARCLAAR